MSSRCMKCLIYNFYYSLLFINPKYQFKLRNLTVQIIKKIVKNISYNMIYIRLTEIFFWAIIHSFPVRLYDFMDIVFSVAKATLHSQMLSICHQNPTTALAQMSLHKLGLGGRPPQMFFFKIRGGGGFMLFYFNFDLINQLYSSFAQLRRL